MRLLVVLFSLTFASSALPDYHRYFDDPLFGRHQSFHIFFGNSNLAFRADFEGRLFPMDRDSRLFEVYGTGQRICQRYYNAANDCDDVVCYNYETDHYGGRKCLTLIDIDVDYCDDRTDVMKAHPTRVRSEDNRSDPIRYSEPMHVDTSFADPPDGQIKVRGLEDFVLTRQPSGNYYPNIIQQTEFNRAVNDEQIYKDCDGEMCREYQANFVADVAYLTYLRTNTSTEASPIYEDGEPVLSEPESKAGAGFFTSTSPDFTSEEEEKKCRNGNGDHIVKVEGFDDC